MTRLHIAIALVLPLAAGACETSHSEHDSADIVVLDRIVPEHRRLGYDTGLEFRMRPDASKPEIVLHPSEDPRFWPRAVDPVKVEIVPIDDPDRQGRRCPAQIGFDWNGDGRDDDLVLAAAPGVTVNQKPDELLVVSRDSRTVLARWSGYFQSACAQVVDREMRVVASTGDSLRVFARDRELTAHGIGGWSLTPCPDEVGRDTSYAGSVAIVRCGGYAVDGATDQDWIEIVKIVPRPDR